MTKRYTYLFCLIAVFFFSRPVAHALNPVVDSIPMSDGKKLAADIYIPPGMTSGPVILIQTPYNRLLYRVALPLNVGINLANSNYIFVIVDWRGFYGSSAAAYTGAPGIGKDGYDVVEWIAAQSWSNGKIGTWGASALGRVQFQTAKTNPPHLTCICPLVAGPQYEYTEYFPGGCLRTEYVDQLNGLGFGITSAIMPHPTHDLVWSFSESANFYPDSIQVPCYMIGGWYDHNVEVMLTFYNAIRTQSPLNVRDQHRLLMGPWVHKGVGSATAGQLNYNNSKDWSDSLALMYFDFHLRNINNGWDASPYVQYYQMGENAWNTSPSWPPAGPVSIPFYLYKDGGLSHVVSDVVNDDSLVYNYDPNDPSPTTGGPTLRVDQQEGPYDQSVLVEGRNDILSFTTYPLTQNVVMKGSAFVHLRVASNRKDTDFDVRLTDVYPDGRSMLVVDGVRRMRFRNGYNPSDTAAMVPGTIYDCNIELPSTCITFPVGHKIRVDISSSNYPRFNRNMNTGGPMYPGNSIDSLVNPVIATNTVYTSFDNPSFIALPLVDFQTAVNEIGNNSTVAVFPNPSSATIEVQPVREKEYRTVVYDILGNTVLEKYNSNKLDISGLGNGVYFLRIYTSGGSYSGKFIKQ